MLNTYFIELEKANRITIEVEASDEFAAEQLATNLWSGDREEFTIYSPVLTIKSTTKYENEK